MYSTDSWNLNQGRLSIRTEQREMEGGVVTIIPSGVGEREAEET